MQTLRTEKKGIRRKCFDIVSFGDLVYTPVEENMPQFKKHVTHHASTSSNIHSQSAAGVAVV